MNSNGGPAAAPLSSHVQPAKAFLALLLAAVLFGVANIAWRYGEGSSFSLAAQRALIGAILFAPVTVAAWRDGRARAVLASPSGRIAIVCSSATMPASALLFRSLTGPQAALCLAITPAVLVVIALLSGRGSNRAVPWVLVSVVAAAWAVVAGGLGGRPLVDYWPAGLNMMLDIVAILALERARRDHQATVLVGMTMVVATLWCSVVGALTSGLSAPPAVGLIAASVVGVCGTTARALRAFALPWFGAAVTFSAGQVSVLLTAIGGVIIFADPLTWASALLGVIAAVTAVVAMAHSTQ